MEKPPEIGIVTIPPSRRAPPSAPTTQSAADISFEYFAPEAFNIMLDDPDNVEPMLKDPAQTKRFSPVQLVSIAKKYKRLGLAILRHEHHREHLSKVSFGEIVIALLLKMSVDELEKLPRQDKILLLRGLIRCASSSDMLGFAQEGKIQALLKNVDAEFTYLYESSHYFILNLLNAYYNQLDAVSMRTLMCSFFSDTLHDMKRECLYSKSLSLRYGQTEVLQLLRVLFTNATDMLDFLKQSLPIERENYFVIHPLKHMSRNKADQQYDDSLNYAIQISQCKNPIEILEPILANPGVFDELQEALATVVAITLLTIQSREADLLSLFENHASNGLLFSLRNRAILTCLPKNGTPYLHKQFPLFRETIVPIVIDNPVMMGTLEAAYITVFPDPEEKQSAQSSESLTPAEAMRSDVSAKAMRSAQSPALHKPSGKPKTTFAAQMVRSNLVAKNFSIDVDMSDENRPKMLITHDKAERYTKAEIDNDAAQLQKLKECMLQDCPVNYATIVDAMKIVNRSDHGIYTATFIIEFTNKDAFKMFFDNFEKLGFYIHRSVKDKVRERSACCIM